MYFHVRDIYLIQIKFNIDINKGELLEKTYGTIRRGEKRWNTNKNTSTESSNNTLDLDWRTTACWTKSWHRNESIIHQGSFTIDEGEDKGTLDVTEGVQRCVCLNLQRSERHTSKIGSTEN